MRVNSRSLRLIAALTYGDKGSCETGTLSDCPFAQQLPADGAIGRDDVARQMLLHMGDI
jgi:hypothetical protein